MKYTYLVDHGAASPSVSPGTTVDGGLVVAVQFNDALDECDKLRTALEDCAESLELELSRLGCPTEGNNGGAHRHDADDFGGIRALASAKEALKL